GVRTMAMRDGSRSGSDETHEIDGGPVHPLRGPMAPMGATMTDTGHASSSCRSTSRDGTTGQVRVGRRAGATRPLAETLPGIRLGSLELLLRHRACTSGR